MIKLFKYEGFHVSISEEALLLKPFKKIWNRDRSESKDKALSELGFIYFYADPRSDYQYIVDDKEREKAIIEGEGLGNKWKPDKLIKEGIEFYNSFKPTSALLLEDTRVAISKLRMLLRDIDLKEVDDKGKPIYTLNMVTSTIKQIPALVTSLDEAERTLISELASVGAVRGQKEKTIFEDGLNI